VAYSGRNGKAGTMETKIVFQVRGVDLSDDVTVDLLARYLDELVWDALGKEVTATLFTDAADPVAASLEAVKKIEATLPGASVPRLDDELVALSDIAAQARVSHEAVRLWANGRRRADSPFPAPRGHVTQGKTIMKVWAWSEVIEWLRSEFCVDPEPGVLFLTPAEAAAINLALTDRTRNGARWRPLQAAPTVHVLAPTKVVVAGAEAVGGRARVRYASISSA